MKKFIIITLAFLSALILPLFSVNAETFKFKRMPLGSFINYYPTDDMYIGRGSETIKLEIHSLGGYNYTDVYGIVDDNNNVTQGYCLSLGKQVYSGASLGKHLGFGELNNSFGHNMLGDINNNATELATQAVLKNILASQGNLGGIDSYVGGAYVADSSDKSVGSCNNSTTCARFFATQLLVWEVMTGGRTGEQGYTKNPQGNLAYQDFVKSNATLRSAYNSILDDAEELSDPNRLALTGETITLNWSDANDRYESNNVTLGNYNYVNPLPDGVSITSKDSNNNVLIYSTKQYKNPETINIELRRGSTTNSTFTWYKFTNHSDAQDILMGNYGLSVSSNFYIQTETGKFNISKIDSETKELLPGSKFELLKCKGSNCEKSELVSEIDLTNNAEEVEVKVNKSGKYILRETVVPYGYTSLQEFIFKINIRNTGTVISDVPGTAPVNIRKDENGIYKESLVVENKPKTITIRKIDGRDNSAVNGATFQVKDENGNLVKFNLDNTGIYRYNANGSITDIVNPSSNEYRLALLPKGKYTIVETNVPYPYVLAGKQQDRETKILIDNNSDLQVYNSSTKNYDKVNNAVVTAKNFLTKVKILKVGTSGKVLPGVQFELYDSTKTKQIPLLKNANTGEYEYSPLATSPIQIITNDQGRATINYLPAGKYYLKETVTIDGYEITKENEWTEIDVVVGKDSSPVIYKSISNAKGEFSFYKIDEDGNYLSDGKFKLQVYNEKTSRYEDVALIYHEKENYYTIDKTGESDIYIFTPINGIVTFKEIDAKTKYRIVEIEAPEGFVLPKESEAYVDLVVSENGYVSGNPILINKKVTVEEEASAQAELVINISTGQDRIRYALIIGGILTVIIALFVIKGKLKK